MDLKDIREDINKIDDKIFELFKERMELSARVAEVKKNQNLPLTNKNREREILSRMSKKSDELMTYTRMLYNTLFTVSKSYQNKLTFEETEFTKGLERASRDTERVFPNKGAIAVQGREGSYSQQASDKLFPLGDIIYFKSFENVFDAVNKGLCEFGLLPLENSSNGSVKEIYDLMMEKDFYIVRGYKLYVKHVLLGKAGSKLEDINEVVSHPQALGQSSRFLKTLPGVTETYSSNTAEAAKHVAESKRMDLAAISSKYCADLYGLEILSDKIQDNENNYTRFICIRKDMKIYPGSGKISLMLTAPHEPGGLYNIMAKFAALGVNVTKLESRPIVGSDFEFMFYFDFEGSVESREIRQMIDELSRSSEGFVFLGNYQEY